MNCRWVTRSRSRKQNRDRERVEPGSGPAVLHRWGGHRAAKNWGKWSKWKIHGTDIGSVDNFGGNDSTLTIDSSKKEVCVNLLGPFYPFCLSHFTRYFQNQSLLRSIYFLCNSFIFVLHNTKASIIILSLTMFDVLKWKEKDQTCFQHKNYTRIFIYVTLCFVTNIQKTCTYTILTLCFSWVS